MSANPFLDAIDLLQEHGWSGDGEGHCIYSAVRLSFNRFPRNSEPFESALRWKLEPFLREAIGVKSTPHVWEWNDAPERSYEDVILALKRAAETWDQAVR